MNVKLKVLTAGVLFFMGSQVVMAQEKKKDEVKEKEIEEVVVVAYGSQKKESVAGSIKEIKSADLKDVQSANVVQGLAGKVAGVQVFSSGQPGDSPLVRMRGIGSISGSSAPLYVVDGVAYNGDIANISSQDIESMTFLKDASANALYGSRGANGVIVITTRKANKKGIQINFDTKVGVSERGVKEYDIITSPSEYYEIYFQRLKLGEMFKTSGALNSADAGIFASANLINGGAGLGYNIYNVSNDKLVDPVTGKFNNSAKLLYKDDWQNALFSPSVRTEHNLSLSSKSDKSSVLLSLGYLNDEGYALNSGFQRYTARINSEYYFNENLKAGANVMYANSAQKSPVDTGSENSYSNMFSFARNMAPIYPIYVRDQNNNILTNSRGVVYDSGKGEFNGQKRIYGAFNNPVAKANYDKYQKSTDAISSRFFATYRFFKDFDFTYNFSADIDNLNDYSLSNPYLGDAQSFGGSVSQSLNRYFTTAHQQLLNWNKKIDNHKFSVLIGHEFNKAKFTDVYGEKQNLVLDFLPVLSNGAKMIDISGGNKNYSNEGYFSRLNYDFMGKYFLNASFRRDASSVFAPESRWGNFYGVGFAWLVNKENFLKNVDFINDFKLKASYGEQGNDYVSLYANNSSYRNYYSYYNQWNIRDVGNGNPGTGYFVNGNRDLKWEKSENMNAGFELSIFNKRINIDAEYFQRGVSNMIYFKQGAISNDAFVTPINSGDMVNRGVEVSLDFDVIRRENFGWSLYGNATHYKNKITKLPVEYITRGDYRLTVGRSRYDYYMIKYAGFNSTNGNAQWYYDDNGTQKITEDFNVATSKGRTFLNKTAIPDVYGGFGTKLKYRNISLSANFSYQIGGYGFDNSYLSLLQSGGDAGRNYHKDIYKSWTPENANVAELPRIDYLSVNQMASSDKFLTSMTYLALQDATVGYEFSKSFNDSFNLSYARIYIAGNNLFLLSSRKGYDPRTSLTGASNNQYGTLRAISLGINVKF